MASAGEDTAEVISNGHVRRLVQHYEESNHSSYVTAATHLSSSTVYESALNVSLTAEDAMPKQSFMTAKEVFSGLTALFSCLYSSVMIKFPGEIHPGRIRGFCILFFSSWYYMIFLTKVKLDWESDGARFFYYTVTRNGNYVFYPKSVVHLTGVLVLVGGVISCLVNLWRAGPWVLYAASLTSSILSGIYGLAQVYKSDPVHVFVTTNEEGQKIGKMLASSPEFPRCGRVIFHVLDPDVPEFVMD